MKFTNIKKILASLAFGATFLGASVVSADSYTVVSGDTLSAIAIKFNTTVDKLVQHNQIKDKHFIVVGQILEITEEGKVPEHTVVEEAASTTPTTAGTYTSTLSAEEVAAKEEIARRESSGSYTAQNGQYYGRYQLTNTYLNGDYSPENQERVADAYVAGRYGSWSAALAFHNANGWY